MTKIDQRIFELCERKEKVHTYKLALLQVLSSTTVLQLWHQRVIHVVPDMLLRNTFSLSPTIFELRAEICSNGKFMPL